MTQQYGQYGTLDGASSSMPVWTNPSPGILEPLRLPSPPAPVSRFTSDPEVECLFGDQWKAAAPWRLSSEAAPKTRDWQCMYVCMYVCVCVCVCVCIYVYMYVCMYVCMYVSN